MEIIKAKIVRIENHSENIFSLYFKREIFQDFIAGQYVTIYIPEISNGEGKAYSISSSPLSDYIQITIKKMGLFSNYLSKLSVGDFVNMSLPYGFFYPTYEYNNIVLIAGGIGITPFKSIIQSCCEINKERNISLLYSAKTKQELTFLDDFRKLSKKIKLDLHFFITQEKIKKEKNFTDSRMSAKKIAETTKNRDQTEFLICGSIQFVREIWKELKNSGIPENQIYTESFF